MMPDDYTSDDGRIGQSGVALCRLVARTGAIYFKSPPFHLRNASSL